MKHLIDDTHRIHALSAITYAINDLEVHIASGKSNDFAQKILQGEVDKWRAAQLALENAPAHHEEKEQK
jgi:hypothetical protein